MVLAALAAEVDILVGADVTGIACSNQGVSGSAYRNTCWAGELEMRFTVGGDGVGGCVDFCADDLQTVCLCLDGWQRICVALALLTCLICFV